MLQRTKFNMDYRPGSYSSPENDLEALLAGVRGEVRKRTLRELLAAGDAAALDAFLAKGSLAPEVREALQRLGPRVAGSAPGTGREHDEIEIAHVAIDAVPPDVVRVMARRRDEGYAYRIWAESGTVFHLRTEWTAAPLSLGELIELMDTAEGASERHLGLTDAYRNDQKDALLEEDPGDARHEESLEALAGCIEVTSAFYPQLNAYYADEAQAWWEAAREELDELAGGEES